MNAKKFIAIVILILCVGIIIYRHFAEGYTIEKVIDGNTIVLNTGTTVKLIGISNTKQAKDALQELKDEGWRFDLQPDSHARFAPDYISDNMTIYAYLLLRDRSQYECVNATLLREGLSDYLEMGMLRDSATVFKKYALEGSGKNVLTPIAPEPIVYEDDDIILPVAPIVPDSANFKRREYQRFTHDKRHDLNMLDSACDYDCQYTRKFALELAAKSPGNFNIGQICETFNYCYNKWRYVNDPTGREYIAYASETIENSLIGDCDDFAVLMASCILAIGGDVCISIARNSYSGHAFTEVDAAYLGSNEEIKAHIKNKFPQYSSQIENIKIRNEGSHRWLNLDWFSAYPGGEYYDYTQIDRYTCIRGNWRY